MSLLERVTWCVLAFHTLWALPRCEGCGPAVDRSTDARQTGDAGPGDAPAPDHQPSPDADPGADGGVRPAPNQRCESAQALELVEGAASVEGDLTGVENEFGEQILCGYCRPMSGPQLYYTLEMATGTVYHIDLAPTFQGQLLVVPADGCEPADLNTSCRRAGSYPGGSGGIAFRPPVTGTYLLVVEDIGQAQGQTFALEVESEPDPCAVQPYPGECCGDSCGTPCESGGIPRDHCAGATEVSVGELAEGSTAGGCMDNEFDELITCGTPTALVGIQTYHKLSLNAGTTYTFTITTHFNMARFYLFADTCDAAEINAACSSLGGTGAVSEEIPAGGSTSLSFTPATTGLYRFAVDSGCASERGYYSVEIVAGG